MIISVVILVTVIILVYIYFFVTYVNAIFVAIDHIITFIIHYHYYSQLSSSHLLFIIIIPNIFHYHIHIQSDSLSHFPICIWYSLFIITFTHGWHLLIVTYYHLYYVLKNKHHFSSLKLLTAVSVFCLHTFDNKYVINVYTTYNLA